MRTKSVMAQAPLLLLLSLFLCGFLAPGQKPALTLKDAKQETTADLYKIDMGENVNEIFLYVNERYGYSALIPLGMAEAVVVIPDNGDGLILASKDGSARFRASGGLAEFVEGGLNGVFATALKNIGPALIEASFYSAESELNQGDKAFCVLTWRQGDTFYKAVSQ